VPAQFKPTHLGLSVQEGEKTGTVTGANGRPKDEFRTWGPVGGGIVSIADATRLHTKKGATTRRARRR
jgi:hypothetical protein